MTMKEPQLLTDFKRNFINVFNRAAQNIHPFINKTHQNLRSVFYNALRLEHHLVHEAQMVEEGLVHIGTASSQDKYNLKRDSVTLVTETALSAAEEMVPEIPVIIAGIEAGEQIMHKKNTGTSAGKILYDTGVSLASSPLAAAHAAVSIVRDLEEIGDHWHALHKSPYRFC